jgi:hypothetical protein
MGNTDEVSHADLSTLPIGAGDPQQAHPQRKSKIRLQRLRAAVRGESAEQSHLRGRRALIDKLLLERLNATLRARCVRLGCKTLSFSKSLRDLIGAIWLFIHDYNRHILLATI